MSDVMVHPVLAELELRAGASDTDRAAWMADRRNGLTATQVRDLVLKGPGYRRELIAQKLGQVDDEGDLSHVPVIGWGRHREPIIAQAVQERYAIAPEHRVFRALDNPRFLASPDGVGVDFMGRLSISEIKTGWADLSVGSPAYVKKGYGIQQCWGMRVTGARRSLYAWEYRLEGETREFVPGDVHFEWVEYDEKLADELVALADGFLAELDAARLALDAGEGPVIDDAIDTLGFNYRRALDEEKAWTKAKTDAFTALKAALAGYETFSQDGETVRITWTRGGTTPSPGEVVDEAGARAASPVAFEALAKAELSAERASARLVKAQKAVEVVLAGHMVPGMTTKTVRENLTVTVPKIKEMGK